MVCVWYTCVSGGPGPEWTYRSLLGRFLPPRPLYGGGLFQIPVVLFLRIRDHHPQVKVVVESLFV